MQVATNVKSFIPSLEPIAKLPETLLTIIAEYVNRRDYDKLTSIFEVFKNINTSILYQSHFPSSFKEVSQLIDSQSQIRQRSLLKRVGQIFCKAPPPIARVKAHLYSARKAAERDAKNYVSVKYANSIANSPKSAHLSELTDGRLAWVFDKRNVMLVNEVGVCSVINTNKTIWNLAALQDGRFAVLHRPNIMICDPDTQALSYFATSTSDLLHLIGFQDGSIGAYGSNLIIWNSDGQRTMEYAGDFHEISELPDGNLACSGYCKISIVSRQGNQIGADIIFPHSINSFTALRDGSLAISVWDEHYRVCTLNVRSAGGDLRQYYQSHFRIRNLIELDDGCMAFVLANVVTIVSRTGTPRPCQLKEVYEDAHCIVQRRNGALAYSGVRGGVFLGDVNPQAILDLATKQASQRRCRMINTRSNVVFSVMAVALSVLYTTYATP